MMLDFDITAERALHFMRLGRWAYIDGSPWPDMDLNSPELWYFQKGYNEANRSNTPIIIHGAHRCLNTYAIKTQSKP